ncbi:UDP-N-acetylmuramate dehydrogenase [Catenibacterium mitsuokai]|uniref:UDP-N-acetylmuramate dehydrogenase n=1 Tax=Catenibacterium mitsuokai TaxID=100886 RepID=UPI002E78B994|nr:UDP-N-acetylmuramate dehydrogenase [Catenibacterium mitsuokai]
MDVKQVYEDLMSMEVGKVIENEPMYKHTTYKVGGPAKIFVKAKDIDSLIQTLKYCRDHDIKRMVIGNGSDLLFSDKEYDGVIISMKSFDDVKMNGSTIVAQAGVSMIALAYSSAKAGLSGFEFMGGIPGDMGGGIFMNAGAYKYCMADVFKCARVLDDELNVITLSKEDMEFSYRHSVLQKHPNWIILDATFEMTAKDPGEIRKVLDKRKERRMSTQPWNFACAGSVFRNPDEKPAWRYIDEAGLRGYEIGGAQVSPKHSNFIVNNGYASAKDILDLIRLVEKTVYEKFEVKLHKEVILVNWD